jgi:hypothetical protein
MNPVNPVNPLSSPSSASSVSGRSLRLRLRQPWTRTGLTAWAGLAASLVAAALYLAPGLGPELAGAFVLTCGPAGAAVMCWVDSGDGVVQASLTLVLSLAATAIVSACMIWLGAWQPRALFAFAALAVISCAARLVRGGPPCCASPR